MKKITVILVVVLLVSGLLTACGTAATTQPAQSGQLGGRQRGSGTPGSSAGGQFGGRATATYVGDAGATSTSVPATVTPVPATAVPTQAPTPLPTLGTTYTISSASLPYDSRITITNNGKENLEVSLYGPLDSDKPLQFLVQVRVGQTGFLQAPRGRYWVSFKSGNTVLNTRIYEIKYGAWACKMVPDGCADAFFPSN